MKTRTLLTVAALSLSAIAVSQAWAQPEYDQIERGRYIATLGDCTACHTTNAKETFAGGVPLNTPFGVLVGANITPDRETGIGDWNFDDFQRAMSEGVGHGGKRLYGAMPFTAYTKVSRKDNADLWAYLQSLQPVHKEVESNQLPFPFNVRTSLIAWNWINFDKGEFKPDMGKSAEWNRGAYLVQGLGHCGTCHTPKNILGGDKDSAYLRGAVLEGWWAPNLTSDAHTGLGKWTQEDIVSYLRTGVNRYDIASGPMADAVKNSTQYWRDEDLKAVATYLKATPEQDVEKPAPLKAEDNRMKNGALIYEAKCSACHAPKGAGGKNIFPQLANNPLVNAPNASSMIHVVLAGSRGVDTDTRPTAPAMPSFSGTLSDAQMADVITYVRNSWGNAAEPVSADDVKDLKEELGR